jgi:hypothetical protein
MSGRLLRLYPQPCDEVPLRGLYLQHHLHGLGKPGRPFVYANFLSSLDGRNAVEDSSRDDAYIPEHIATESNLRQLSEESVAEYLRSNITMLRWMIDNGYEDTRTLERRARAMEEWLENPSLMCADVDAEYAEVIEINMSEITEPLLACPTDPDDEKPLSEIAGTQIDEVFIISRNTGTTDGGVAAGASSTTSSASVWRSSLSRSPPYRNSYVFCIIPPIPDRSRLPVSCCLQA